MLPALMPAVIQAVIQAGVQAGVQYCQCQCQCQWDAAECCRAEQKPNKYVCAFRAPGILRDARGQRHSSCLPTRLPSRSGLLTAGANKRAASSISRANKPGSHRPYRA